MALNTKIDLAISADWKTITITDTTGFGIAGYGSNQDPVGYRQAASSGNDIWRTRIVLTSPSLATYTFVLNNSQAYNAVINGYQISNVDLGYAIDEDIDEGIWTIAYTPYMTNDAATVFTLLSATSAVYSVPADIYAYKNADKLIVVDEFAVATYTNVTANNPSTGILTLVPETAFDLGASQDTIYSGYTATECLPIVKTIKDCLDSKVAALPNSNCPCKSKQVNTLMNNYILYDAMFINAANNNATKAVYIYDILSNYCSSSDCKCND